MKESKSSASLFSYQDDRVLKGIVQVISAIVVLGFLYFFISNVLEAAEARGLLLGYGFLDYSAGFPIGESIIIEYEPSMSFLVAFAVGVLNTLKVSLIGIVLATMLGIIVGVSRLSSNWLVRNIANIYVETFRNVPLLVLLFFIFFGVFQTLPGVRESINLADIIIINQRGFYISWFYPTDSTLVWIVILALSIILAMIVFVILGRYQLRTGRETHPFLWGLGIAVIPPLISWFLLPERPLAPNVPVLGNFNYEGGLVFTTQFAALLLGLVVYTAAFIAEIVRAGIQAVSKGQVEAARAVGLKPFQSLRLVIFPQALRVIIPPLISQYLNLTKNSSLAIAIGYPDLFGVGRIMINQAGRAVPVFLMIMGTYLLISLTFSVILNIYNRRIAFTER
jgi:general L-amino acid transport system permease protein